MDSDVINLSDKVNVLRGIDQKLGTDIINLIFEKTLDFTRKICIKLESDGLIIQDGTSKTHYRITEKGKQFLYQHYNGI